MCVYTDGPRERNSIVPLPPQQQLFAGIISVLKQSVVFVANKACVFACLCYRLGSQSVHLYVYFTPVLLQHRNISEHEYEYVMV